MHPSCLCIFSIPSFVISLPSISHLELNSIYLGGGNPRINLPLDTSNYTFVNLPPESEFKTPSPISFGKYYYEYHGESLYLENGLNSDACDSFDPTNTQYIIGVLSGCDPNVSTNCLVRYGRYFELSENTVDSPSTNGGNGIETCSNVKMNFLNAESCRLQADACNSDTYYTDEILAPAGLTLVCGSNHEVANDPEGDPIFQLARATEVKNDGETEAQKRNVWTMISLSDSTKDQLRQRVAWALSQILVITQNQINRVEFSELYLAYYDIFTRNAFGNYFDILKEVSYSPMMVCYSCQILLIKTYCVLVSHTKKLNFIFNRERCFLTLVQKVYLIFWKIRALFRILMKTMLVSRNLCFSFFLTFDFFTQQHTLLSFLY